MFTPANRSDLREAPRDVCRSLAGFSLIEVAVAISLLGILAISALLTLIPISRQTRVNREVEVAASEARNILERVQATPFKDIVTLYPDGEIIEVAALEEGQVTVTYGDVEADPLEMQLTLDWVSSDLGTMSQTFTTVKTE